MVVAYIGVGSNIGDREKNILTALGFLASQRGIELLRSSSLRETKAVGPRQRDFVNGVVKLRTLLTASRLLGVLKETERLMGRKRTRRWGPRNIDLDVLTYGHRVISTTNLSVPHPRMHLRPFVLEPLSEIAPKMVHPVFHTTVRKLAVSSRAERTKGARHV